ncbi:MAG: peptidoglycan editing factor PgeF [Lachnospiraceae bacterium]|nr:peptidoglycan editing factor PgeF [Lachnospiraceae bacterium]
MKEECYPVLRQEEKPVMIQNRAGDMEYLTFPLLEDISCIRHLFTTRLGGISKGMYASMNLSFTRGDEKEAVMENFRRVGRVLQVLPQAFVCSDQTHTTNIRVVSKEDMGKGLVRERDYSDVDGLITKEKGIVLSTFYADCVPLYFVDPVREVIGLSHSGWKGTVGKIGQKTVQRMQEEFGSKPEELLCAIGPSICKDCYEVSEDVALQMESCFLGKKEILEQILFFKGNGKYQLDLWKANRFILEEAGVKREHIQITDICTCHNPDYLFSHRASMGKRGNLGAFIMLRQV